MTTLLPDLDLFLSVARHGSFSRAARERGLTRSAVSHAIRDLEAQLDVRLFNRTTRSVAPTEAGLALIAELSPAIETVTQALARIDEFRDAPHGTLRINMPRSAVPILAAMLPEFTASYPHIHLDVVTDDRLIDIVRDGYDAGVRFGESLAMDMIATPFGPWQRMVATASPAYLARNPTPRTPSDLLSHPCITRRFSHGAIYRWEFEKDGRAQNIAVNGPYIFDDPTLALAVARAGTAIAFTFERFARDDIASGALVPILEDWSPAFPGFHLYYPSRRLMPRALRVFVDFIQQFDDWGVIDA